MSLPSGARQIALAEVGGTLAGVVSWGPSEATGAPVLELAARTWRLRTAAPA